MDKDEYAEFAKRSESLINPENTTAVSFLGGFLKYLPSAAQRRLMAAGNGKVPYMGFIVDPYCLFLAFPIKDRAAAQAMLPDAYELADTSVFADGPKEPAVIISSFTIRTSVFTGMRVECYLIARNKATGRVAWIIVDYETNTLSHDPKNGFCGYSCDRALFAVTPYGELLAEAVDEKKGNRFSLRADIREGRFKALDEALWVEGNMAVDYGGRLKDPGSAPFSLIFDPVLMKEAREIDLGGVRITENTLMANIIDGARPTCAALFPYTQHFVIKQDPAGANPATADELRAQLRAFMERKDLRPMKASDTTAPLLRGMLASAIVNAAIIAALAILAIFF